MNRINQLISILLLLLFAFYSGGYFVIFNWQQNLIREEMEQKILKGIPDDQIMVLKIPVEIQKENSSVFKRIRKNEFSYKGQLYDITREEQVNNTTWFYCVQDNEENELVSRLNEFKKKNENNNPVEKTKSQILNSLVWSPYDINKISNEHINICIRNLLTIYFFSLKVWSDRPFLPPPKV